MTRVSGTLIFVSEIGIVFAVHVWHSCVSDDPEIPFSWHLCAATSISSFLRSYMVRVITHCRDETSLKLAETEWCNIQF